MEIDQDETILNDDCTVDDILRKCGIRTGTPQKNFDTKQQSKPKVNIYDLSDSDEDDFDNIIASAKKPKRSPKVANVKTILEQETKAKRKLESEQKKNEALKNKEIKKLMNAANKNLKPEECIKFVTTIIDQTITNNFGTNICMPLKGLGCDYTITSQLIPNTITWTRRCDSHYVDDVSGALKTVTTTEEMPDLLLILSVQEVLELVKEHKLVEHLKAIQSIYVGKNVSLGVMGLEKYLNNQKRRSNNSPTKHEISSALTEIQLFCNCCYRNIDCEADLAAMLCQFTKSIAQRPYKLQQEEKNIQANWYMKGDNKDCVKVDKKGNGLKRLWQQQLTSFPLARLETAESIVEKYPTVNSLMQAYDSCMPNEREPLLADIVIRRHAGPITSSRRIGRELSKKIHIFYNSLDGDAVIG